jgi:hypothetical protein
VVTASSQEAVDIVAQDDDADTPIEYAAYTCGVHVVQWLLEQGKPREALEAATESASKNMLRRHSVTKIGNAYLNDLVQSGDFGLAARQCQKLLKQDTVLWERWVHVFNMHEELAIIAPFIPVK